MVILVFNVGSTTLKYACLNTETGQRITDATIDRIGQAGGDAVDHLSAAKAVLALHEGLEVDAIGHRIVQGGDLFSAPALVTDQSLATLGSLDSLAPLHNPPARSVVQTVCQLAVAVPQVMVFDTAYFAQLPPHVYRYALPESIYRDHAVRRYGAHGTSHRYVTKRAIDWLVKNRQMKPDALRIISLHLGGGASATASLGGVAVETSMGMTPLEGLVMATRCGDLDPSVPLHLIRQAGMSVDQVDHLMNKQSGLVGLCGDPDMRRVLARQQQGDADATLAIDVYVHRLIKMIGGYVAVLGGIDALIFTAGVGENASLIRSRVAQRMNYLGLAIDAKANEGRPKGGEILDLTAVGSPVQTIVVPTDEERAIADQTANLVANLP